MVRSFVFVVDAVFSMLGHNHKTCIIHFQVGHNGLALLAVEKLHEALSDMAPVTWAFHSSRPLITSYKAAVASPLTPLSHVLHQTLPSSHCLLAPMTAGTPLFHYVPNTQNRVWNTGRT